MQQKKILRKLQGRVNEYARPANVDSIIKKESIMERNKDIEDKE